MQTIFPRCPGTRWPFGSLAGRVLAIDCGASHVACGVFARGAAGRIRLEHYALERLDADPDADDRWHAGLERAMTAVAAAPAVRGRCRLALPGHVTLTKFTSAPSLGAKASPEAASFEAQQGIPCPLDQVVWDHLVLADDGLDREVMLAAAKVETIGAIHAAVAGAGLVVDQIVPAGLALVRAFRLRHPGMADAVVVADIGARSTNLVFLSPGHYYIRTLPFGGNAVTRAVADELGLDFAGGEDVKRRLSAPEVLAADDSPNGTAVRQAAIRFAARLQLEIVRTTAGCQKHRSALEPAALHLLGGGSLLPSLPALLAESLQIRVARFDPLDGVERDDRLQGPGHVESAALGSLVGLGAAGLDRLSPGLNLLPPDQAQRVSQRRRGPALATAVTCAVLTPVPLIGYQRAALQVAEDDLRRLDERLAPLQALAGTRAAGAAGLAEMAEDAATLRRLVGAKSGWTEFLADLQGRFEAARDVWLDRMQILAVPPAAGTPPGTTPTLRLAIGGRMIEAGNISALPGPDAFRRVDRLLQSLGRSPFVQGIDGERFDNGQPGILRFDCVLRIKPDVL